MRIHLLNNPDNPLPKLIVKPFLRWAGGKGWLLKHLPKFLPKYIDNYFEPFLGGGAVFIFLKQTGKIKGQCVLSDSNKELIDCYIQIRDDVESVIKHLKTYQNKEYIYYQIRNSSPTDRSEKAARFVFLNRTSFNGIYRVNLKGIYNVPYGYKKYSLLFDWNNLRAVSKLLNGTIIINADFKSSLIQAKRGDFAYLDPPYTVAHGNNGFIKYNQKIFAWNDQERLASSINNLIYKGVYYVLSNAAHPSIERIFGQYGTKMEISRNSVIGGKKASRGIQNEYIFYNSSNL